MLWGASNAGATLVLTVGLCACSAPLEFSDWTIPVAEGTRVIDFAPVPIGERSEHIGIEESLRVGGGDDPQGSLYRPIDLAVADDGRLYVLDAGDHRIQVFGAEGGYVASLGREGDGPGEIRRGGDLVTAGNALVRVGDGRVTVWSLDGELLSDTSIADGGAPDDAAGLPDGSLLALQSRPSPDDSATVIASFVRLGTDGRQRAVYADLRGTRRTVTVMSENGATIVRLPTPAPVGTTSRRGNVYLTHADEYQILALSPDAEVRWALRTAWPRLEMTAADREQAVLRRVAGMATDDLDVAWPSHHPALANGGAGHAALHVDGHGHLYVFPFVRPSESRQDGAGENDEAAAGGAGAPFPVDVYDAEGQRLFTGLIEIPGWRDAAGDFVYRFEQVPVSEERVVVRYRLREPFGEGGR